MMSRRERNEMQIEEFIRTDLFKMEMILYKKEIKKLEKKYDKIIISRGGFYRGKRDLYCCTVFKRFL